MRPGSASQGASASDVVTERSPYEALSRVIAGRARSDQGWAFTRRCLVEKASGRGHLLMHISNLITEPRSHFHRQALARLIDFKCLFFVLQKLKLLGNAHFLFECCLIFRFKFVYLAEYRLGIYFLVQM